MNKLHYKTIEILLIRGIDNNSTELIGNTPPIKLNRLTRGTEAEAVAKLESLNPLGSVKDRIGVSMIVDVKKKKCLLKKI